jgi:LytS/YehU family sensor histidine kinase
MLVSTGVLLAVGGRIVLEGIFGVSPNNTLTGNQYVIELIIGEVYVQGFITAFKLLLDWGRNQKRMRELQKHNFETELDFLRSQVQPHFFFNTLNNLYSLTLDKSDLAPDTVIKLSELMSYVIYDGKQKKVALAKEVSYIQNYLDLERLRFGNKLKTTFQVKGQVQNQKISPLLMLPFLENSFKHGVGDGVNEIRIDIGLEINDNNVVFKVKNQNFNQLNNSNPGPYHHIGHNGVGIKNIKRRLNLIYGSQYQLDINDRSDFYTVTLNIPTYED